MDLTRGKYQILGADDTTETANIKAMIDSAPETEPTLAQYPNKLAFLKAKLRWQMAKKYSGSQEIPNE
jgi:3-deoxy-D-manno-octulosonic-acid transferase